jgi:excisionase family DNA binding protein
MAVRRRGWEEAGLRGDFLGTMWRNSARGWVGIGAGRKMRRFGLPEVAAAAWGDVNFHENYRKLLETANKTELNTKLPADRPESGDISSFWEWFMRNAAVRSNLLVPEVREVMDIRQASDYLGISPDTLYKYASEGFVPAFKLGNRWRFKRSRLDEWMDRQSDMQAGGADVDPEQKKPVKAAI